MRLSFTGFVLIKYNQVNAVKTTSVSFEWVRVKLDVELRASARNVKT